MNLQLQSTICIGNLQFAIYNVENILKQRGNVKIHTILHFSNAFCDMHAIEKHYYKINSVFLKILGLWPYEQSYFTLVRKMLFAVILFTHIIVQVS